MTRSISNDIVKPMAIKPRLVVELNYPEEIKRVKLIALENDTTIKEMVLLSLGEKYPQLMDWALKELEK